VSVNVMTSNTDIKDCISGKKHHYDLVVATARSGLVKCLRCGHTKKIGDTF